MLHFEVFDQANNLVYTIQGGDLALGFIAGILVVLCFWITFKEV